jgi:hypothetical protein
MQDLKPRPPDLSPHQSGPGAAVAQNNPPAEAVVTINRDGTIAASDATARTQAAGSPCGEAKPEQAVARQPACAAQAAGGLISAKYPSWDDLDARSESNPAAGRVTSPPVPVPADGALLGPQQAAFGSQEASPGEADGPPAEGQPPALDSIVQELLAAVKPGWNPAELDAWLYDRFLATLADFEGLTAAALTRYLDGLIARLKDVGHKPRTLKQYKALWKSIAKDRAAERRAQRLAEAADQKATGLAPGRFAVRPLRLPAAHDPRFLNPFTGQPRDDAPPLADLQTEAIFDNENAEPLTNFNIAIDEEVEVQDQFEQHKLFKGKLKIFGREVPFAIDARDFADNNKLRAKITETAGLAAVIHGKMDLVREAISTLNWAPGRHTPRRRVVSTDFGWTPGGDAFLVPGGRITAEGFAAVSGQAERRVELDGEELAQHLGLRPLPGPEELRRVKRHVVEDLLRLHRPRVTYTLLGAMAAAVLARHAPSADPFALWLTGLTGAGKSFVAKLFMNFFGDFPVTSGRFAAWSATANYLQRQGYFFKDALYLVDDYKPELAQHYQVVRVLQNYADRTGRGRLKSDATTNTTRPIRGLLVCTGEDLPEHTASALARSVVVEVPQQEKDLARGARCVAEARHYPGVTDAFVQHLLAQGRLAAFAEAVAAQRQCYYADIAGQQNDSRIAGNFALLAAGFSEAARFFADVWPEWEREVERFVGEDLRAVRDGMLGTVREQQPSEIFWSVLAALVEHEAVTFDSWAGDSKGKPVIGKRVIPGPKDLVYISTDLALAEVNQCLRAQGKPELKVTVATLLGQLRREGRLFNCQGQPLSPEGEDSPTKQLRIGGGVRRSFLTSRTLLCEASDLPPSLQALRAPEARGA